MDSQKTLIDIAQVAQQVVGALVQHSGRRTVESFQLERIIVGASALLEALIKTSLLNDGRMDDRLGDWLTSNEPQACLQTLKRMAAILNTRHTHRRGIFLGTSSSIDSQDMSNEAARLFQLHKGYFHYLLVPVEVWNRETNNSRSNTLAEHDLSLVGEAIDSCKVQQITRRNKCCVPRGEMERQGIDAEKLGSILRWLDAWSCQDVHRRIMRLRQPDTCAWLPKTNEFKTWRSTENSFLWLHGKAGAGKSVLAASVIENLKETLEDGELLAFFYCDFRSERSTSAAEVLRSLLSQLLRQSRWNVVDHGDLIDELVKQSNEGSSTVNDVMLLANYISRVVGWFNQRPCIVIDALDECNHIEELLDALMELSKSNLRLLVISRPLQVVKDGLFELPSISMDTMKYEVMMDIKLHITRVLDSHRRLRIMDTNLKEEVYSTLSENADGMFRWVQCQLDILKRCMTPARIRETLENLPNDLDATYSRILFGIDKIEEGEIARRALEWLVAALKPLQLSQLMEALSIDLEQRVVDHSYGPVHGPALLDALSSLVTHDEWTDIVILSHFSVKEYLTGETACTKFPIYHVNQQAAHTQLVLCCMCYISAYLKQCDIAVASSVDCLGDYSQSSVSNINPLFEYVLHYGFVHLAHVDPRNRTILQAIVEFVSETQRNPSKWARLCNDRFPWPPRILKHDLTLYILVTFGQETMLRFYLDTAKPKPKDGTNPLIYGARSRVESCRTLLSRGASLIHRGWDYYLPHQVLPLEVALRYSSVDVVDLFLKAESPVPPELFVEVLGPQRDDFPSRNVARLLQTDEFAEWATSIRSEELLLRALDPVQYPPFITDTEKDFQMIQWRLIQLNHNPRNRYNVESLYLAASAGHISTVKDMLSSGVQLPHDIILRASSGLFNSKAAMIQFLLGVGSNVHATSPDDDSTPLHLVLDSFSFEADRLQCVQLLVRAGCDPSSYDLTEETPLHVAAGEGYISIIEYLLSLHVQLPPDILLRAASRSPRTAVTVFLIGRGASVHIVAADGATPLHLALRDFNSHWHNDSEKGLEYLNIFMGAGCNPCFPDALGQTALDVAAQYSNPKIVQYLLSFGVPLSSSLLQSACRGDSNQGASMIKFLISKGLDTNSRCENGDNLLHLSMRIHEDTECLRRVKILVNAGCDIRARNLAGETPFHVAARFGHIPVIEYLFSLGLSIPLDETFINILLKGLFKSYLSRSAHHWRTVIRFLVDTGIGVQIIGKNGRGLLHAVSAAVELWEEEALELVKFLVHSGCKPSALDFNQETPLHLAARCGNIPVLCCLLSLDPILPVDILLAASKGGVPLAGRKTEVIRWLVNKGAHASVTTTTGDTPLHLLLACWRGDYDETDSLESTKILVSAGCDPSSQNLAGDTPLHNAARSGFISVLKYFLSEGILLPPDILFSSRPVVARFLLKERLDVCKSISFNDNKELLPRILDFDHEPSLDSDEDEYIVECARILVEMGCDPSSYSPSGETPMHVAARRGRTSVVKYLLSQRVLLPPDIVLSTMPGKGPGSLMTTRFLVREGASVNVTAPNGDTPLHLALRRRNFSSDPRGIRPVSWELIQTLLNSGSDPTARNMEGQTPLGMAEERGHFFKENFLRLVRDSAHARTST